MQKFMLYCHFFQTIMLHPQGIQRIKRRWLDKQKCALEATQSQCSKGFFEPEFWYDRYVLMNRLLLTNSTLDHQTCTTLCSYESDSVFYSINQLVVLDKTVWYQLSSIPITICFSWSNYHAAQHLVDSMFSFSLCKLCRRITSFCVHNTTDYWVRWIRNSVQHSKLWICWVKLFTQLIL